MSLEPVNMKPLVMNYLKSVPELKKVTQKYPSDWNVFPMAIFSTSQKPISFDFDNTELETEWTIKIELYTNTGSLTDIRDTIVEKFNSIGFAGKGRDSNTAKLTRVVCEFKAIICNETNHVYRSK